MGWKNYYRRGCIELQGCSSVNKVLDECVFFSFSGYGNLINTDSVLVSYFLYVESFSLVFFALKERKLVRMQ